MYFISQQYTYIQMIKCPLFWCLIFTEIFYFVTPIKFGMVIDKRMSECFKQNVEKQTRYQISVKSNSSRFYIHVNEDKITLHQDTSNTPNQQYKYFSAYAHSNGQILFCVGSLNQDEPILVTIEFYHGLHLQDSPQSMSQLLDIGQRISQLKDLIKMNYGMYHTTLASRKDMGTQFNFWIILTTILIVLGSAIAQYLLFRGISKYLRYKKIL